MVVPVMIGAYGGYGPPEKPGKEVNLNVPPRALNTITVRATSGQSGISALSFVYLATDKTTVSVGPWGTDSSGTQNPPISIKEGEYVLQVSGTCDNTTVNSLEITTNFSKYTYGTAKGNPFSVPVKNGKIVGFFGNAGPSGLNALGVYVIPRK